MSNLKLKLLTYPSVSVLIGACVAVITYFAGGYTVLGAVLLGIGGGLVASCLARIALHMSQGDFSPWMFQVAIYHAMIACGYLIFVLAQGWGAIYFGVAVMVGATMMCLFTRFLESDEGKVFQIVEEMARTERYYPVGDVPGAPEDLARPVCSVDGVNYTIAEAEEKGFRQEASEARKNLYRVYSATVENERKGEKE